MESNNSLIEKYNEIGNFIRNAESRIQNILKTLNWNETDTKKESCFNSPNKASNTLISNPLNCDLDSQLYPESITTINSVKLDSNILAEITKKPKLVPESVADHQKNFTSEEKLKIYEFIISKTEKLTVPEIQIIPNDEANKSKQKPSTFAEIVALKRDLKRRPLKNRTTKAPPLSLTEELRGLIDLQMQSFIEHEMNKSIDSEKSKAKNTKISSDVNPEKKHHDLHYKNLKRSKSRDSKEKYYSKRFKETKTKDRDVENTKNEFKSKKRRRSRSLSTERRLHDKKRHKQSRPEHSPENLSKDDKKHKSKKTKKHKRKKNKKHKS